MPIQFANWPALLLIPLALPYFWWQHRRTVTDMSAGRKRLALLLRCLLALLLILALAGTRFVRQGESLAVVFVVDGSRSIQQAQRAVIQQYLQEAARGMRPQDKAGLITFAQAPHTQSSPGQPLDAMRLKDPGQTAATNIAQALRQAGNELETAARDSGKRIVLLSDGNETAGRALAEMPELTANQIRLDTVTLPATLTREALIEKTLVSRQVKIGEPFVVRVVVSSLTPQTATVTLTRDGQPAAEPKRVPLRRGKTVVVFENQRIVRPGFFRFEATLDAKEDTLAENNRGEALVNIRGKPAVLYVADDPGLTAFLRKALQGQNIEIAYAPPEAMPTTAATLQRFDSIFLSNVYAGQFSLAQLRALQVAVRDFGVGFGMVGGENSFGAGGYRGTPIEEVLPVNLDSKKTLRLPAICVALVIDRSGSMVGEKLELAREAAARAAQILKPSDRVAVISFDSAGTLHVPLTPASEQAKILNGIRTINPGGGTSIYAGAKLAFDTIKDDPTPIKHIILLTDGISNDPDYRPLVAELKRRKITVSGVAIGGETRDAYGPTLAWLAKETGGRFFMVENLAQLPSLYLQEIERIAAPPIVEEPFQALPVDGDEVFKGFDWNSAPPLLGYNLANLKPTADLSLITPRKDPLFAGWRYGLGRSVAFLSDDRARWAAQWLGWSGYAPFWAQAVRWSLRTFAPNDYATQVTLEGSQGHITVDAQDDRGRYINKLKLRALVAPPGTGGLQSAETQEVPLRQTGPGFYEGFFEAPEIGTYLVNVLESSPNGPGAVKSTILGLSTAYSPEYRATQPNDYLMTQLAQTGGGRVNPPPSAIFGSDRPGVYAAADLTRLLLLLAVCLLPLDIAVRRITVEREDLRRLREWVFGKRREATPSHAATPELARLRDVKSGVGGQWSVVSEEGSSSLPAALETQSHRGRASREGATIQNPPPSVLGPPPVEPDAQRPTSDAEESGLSRLLDAKRRAQQRQEQEREER